MKLLNKIFGIALLAIALIVASPGKGKAQYITSQDFYDSLSDYGTWVYDPQYGDVWVPDAEDGFRPYATRGHWVLTEYGYTWVSGYPWGWATFHYGRWHYDDYYGWEWVPGYEWAPAWVSWRQGGGYFGWAPLTPGLNISVTFGGGYNIPDRYWVCAPQRYINSPNIYNYYAPHTTVVNVIHNTTIINNTYVQGNTRYVAGPRVADVQRITHERPQVYRINNASEPGRVEVGHNSVTIFRPAVQKAPEARPQRVVDAQAYRQQNPDQGIAHRGAGGAPAFNHANAVKLANVARSEAPDNNVVRINPRGNGQQQDNSHFQQGGKPGNDQRSRFGQPSGQPQQGAPQGGQPENLGLGNRGDQQRNQQNNPQQGQPANGGGEQNNGQRGRGFGRPEDRPNINPANPQQARDQQMQQQQATDRQRQQSEQQARDQQMQQQRQQQMQQQARDQQMQQQQAADRQRQQSEQQARDRQMQQRARDQQMQQQQARDQQMQQQAVQRQQQQARDQQMQQQQAVQRQQQQARDQQMQQQQAVQRQQQQARDQQMQQQRQQQMQQQQAQQQAQRQQQQAQQQAQRQQQMQQQRAQQQQKQQQQAPPPPRPPEQHQQDQKDQKPPQQ